MLCVVAPYVNEGMICCLSELYHGDFLVCVQLNAPLSTHRNNVSEYCNKTTFEVIYKIFKNL